MCDYVLMYIGNSSALLYLIKHTGKKCLPCSFSLTSRRNNDGVCYYLVNT